MVQIYGCSVLEIGLGTERMYNEVSEKEPCTVVKYSGVSARKPCDAQTKGNHNVRAHSAQRNAMQKKQPHI